MSFASIGLTSSFLRVEIHRNFTSLPFPLAMTKDQRIAAEERISAALDTMAKNKRLRGVYYSQTPSHSCYHSPARLKEAGQ